MNIKEVTSNTKMGEYILDCYYRSDKKYLSGMFCGKMLIRKFKAEDILDIFSIYMKELIQENSYCFRQFKKGLIKGIKIGEEKN